MSMNREKIPLLPILIDIVSEQLSTCAYINGHIGVEDPFHGDFDGIDAVSRFLRAEIGFFMVLPSQNHRSGGDVDAASGS